MKSAKNPNTSVHTDEDVLLLRAELAEARRQLVIEAALERVRLRAMTTQSSDEGQAVVTVLFAELEKLGFDISHCSSWLFDKEELLAYVWMPNSVTSGLPECYTLPYRDHPVLHAFLNAWTEQQQEWVYEISSELKNSWHEILFSETGLALLPEQIKESMRARERIVISATFTKFGALQSVDSKPLDKQDFEILERFGRVLDLAYVRFDDLRKAEERTREAQIEAALERIRAAAMAMHTSDDLYQVIVELRRQMDSLNQHEICAIHLYDDDPESILSMSAYRLPDAPEEIYTTSFRIPRQGLAIIDEVLARYESDEADYVVVVDGEENLEWREFLRTVTPEVFEDFRPVLEADDDIPVRAYWALSDFAGGSMGLVTHQPPDAESLDLVRRAANVFDLAYRRFKDLQQAEAQAREAQIEAALERVRSRTMAMQRSTELADIVGKIFAELTQLDFVLTRCIIWIFDEEKNASWWMANPEVESGAVSFHVPYNEYPVFQAHLRAWQQREPVMLYTLSGKAKVEFDDYLFADSGLANLPQVAHEGMREPEAVYLSNSANDFGSLMVSGLEPLSIANLDIIQRFGRVFQQSYTRFIDVQQAEEQAREAQIEAALETVRSRSLAMHASDELGDVVVVIVEKLKDLGVVLDANGVILCTYFPDSRDVLHWISAPDFSFAGSYLLPYFDHLIFREAWESKESGAGYFSKAYSVEEKNSFFEHAFEHSDYRKFPDEFKEWVFQNDQHILSFAWQKNSAILIPSHTGITPSETDAAILKRFANVFEQSYVRFLDLKKAEAQARESRVQLALERVRARTMAMHQSNELAETASVLFQQIKELGFETWSCGFCIWQENDMVEAWMAADSGGLLPPIYIPYKEEPTHRDIYEASSQSDTGHEKIWEGEALEQHYDFLVTIPSVNAAIEQLTNAGLSLPSKQCYYVGFFKRGYLLMITTQPKAEGGEISRRFASVFDLTYTRFLDLQRAEAQSREAKIEASLEKVRGRAMAMQQPDDLSDVSILMFDQLAALGIETLRSGISIPLDDERYEFRAATKRPDGKTTLVVGNESVNIHRIIRRAYDGWKKQEDHQKTVLQGEDLVEYYHAVFDTMPLPDWKERMRTGAEAQESFATFPFSDGWLYVFMRNEIIDEQISVFVRFAKVFGLAYQRYHDLTQAAKDYKALLDEKARTEQALSDLKATQKQLIEQEKLASLGSLTAGIAHEIKNPLNFVNNFAEVSTELVEELSEAIASGKSEEAQSILAEITSNAQQIAKHGKRADSIVKAMMQHARGGSSEPEQINLNQFIEEYINLSWHGMRARDHGFQAEVVRKFDETVDEIRVQPQEMGRVILNLLNNAFDALKGIDPAQVTVTTQRTESGVEITVADNGPGIPEAIRERIFEPFFTTKATGEGTGLGLSLSYDIVTKGHGGRMILGEAPGGGAIFSIQLPA